MTARKPVAPFYAVAVLWLAYALLFPLYRPMHFILLALASAVTLAAVNALCKGAAADDGEKKAERKRRRKRLPPEMRSWTKCSRTESWPLRR